MSSNSVHIANLNPWRYAGYQWDSETQMYYLQARYYRQDIAIFISRDVLGATSMPSLDPEGSYAYAGGDPTQRADGSGARWYPTWRVNWSTYNMYRTSTWQRTWWGGSLLRNAKKPGNGLYKTWKSRKHYNYKEAKGSEASHRTQAWKHAEKIRRPWRWYRGWDDLSAWHRNNQMYRWEQSLTQHLKNAELMRHMKWERWHWENRWFS